MMAGIEREDGFVEAAGARLAVRRLRPPAGTGEGAPLVLLHEGLGSIPQWKRFPERLVAAAGRPALLYERRGHGRSDPAAGPRGLDYLHRAAFDELPAVLSACGVADPVLVGHSDGATIALLYAARLRCRGVVSIAGHVLVETEALDGIRRTMARLDADGLRGGLERHHGERTDDLLHAWADTWTAPWFRGWDIRAELEPVRCPMLVVQGADDEYASPGHVDEIASAVGGPTDTWLVPGQGHAPHLTASEPVVQRVAAWIRSLSLD